MPHIESISLFDAVKDTPPTPAEIIGEQVFTVSGAVDLINGILEPLSLMIEGEVSGFKVSQSKWVYFDIKDDTSTLNCFMMVHQLPFMLEDGMKIKLQGAPKVRGKSGKFSITVKSFELLGEGALLKAFEELKNKLASEGLFDQRFKKPLPFFPKRIGLITSKTGDALQDMLRIMKNRAGGLKIYLIPVAVQGQSAVAQVCRAIEYFNTHAPTDVLIVARGGGSLEDLQAFNTEPVVRAIFASKIPVVTGVGHEPDVTLVDFVSDCRAATPTNAAELITPDFDQLIKDLQHQNARLKTALSQLIQMKRAVLDKLVHRVSQSLREPFHQVDMLKERIIYQLKQRERLFWSRKNEIDSITRSFVLARESLIQTKLQQLLMHEKSMEMLNPKRVLDRGYAIVTNPSGQIIRSTKQVTVGDVIVVQVADGSIHTKAEKNNEES